MQWNVTPEFVSLLIIFILIVYSNQYNRLPNLKNKMFRFCLYFVFVEIIISIISIFAIEYYQIIPNYINLSIQSVYFLASPMIAVLFYLYVISIIKENEPQIGTYFKIAIIPYVLYAILVMTNPLTDLLYFFSESQGFTFGKGFLLIYIFPAMYMFAMIVSIFMQRKRMGKQMSMVLFSFPFFSLLMLIIQLIFPTLILSGIGATAALLILYLYLQTQQIVIANNVLMFQNEEKEKRATELAITKELLEKANNKLLETLRYTRDLIEVNLDPLVTISPNGLITDVNKAMEIATGFSRDKLINTEFHTLFMDSDRAKILYQQAFKVEKIIDFELQLKNNNGTSIPVLYTASVYKNNNGQVSGLFAAARDISKLRKAQDELEELNEHLEILVEKRTNQLSESKKYYELIFNKIPDAALITRFSDGKILSVNDSFKDFFEYTPEEIVGQTQPELDLYQNDSDRPNIVKELRENGFCINKEIVFKRKNGSNFTGLLSATSIMKEDVLCVSSYIRDISKRIQFEELLKQQRKSLLESQAIAHLGTWRLDVKTNEVIWTEELYKMYGFDSTLPPPDYTEHMKLFTPESWEKLSRSLALTSSEGTPYEIELETVTKDGSNGWMWARGEAEKDDNGEIVAVWGAAQDITERIKTLNSLKESEHRLDIFFHQSLTGFFIMMMDKPIDWNDTIDKEEVLNYIFDHQLCTRVNQAMLDQYGMNINEFLHKTPRDMFAHDIKGGKDAWRNMLDNGELHVVTDERKVDGTQIFIEGDYRCLYDPLGRFIGHFGNQQDVTDKLQYIKNLEYLSNNDNLTDLHNRHYYFEQFSKLNKPIYFPLGIMMIDVNGLKIINDALGHTIGDIALKMLAGVLKETFEQKDIVSRIGGDEFTVLIPNTSAEKLQAYKEHIVAIVKTLRVENIELSLAIGYELKKSTTEDIDDIQKLAENDMYRHKSTEGSSVRSHAINAILQALTDKYDTERVHSERVSHLCKLVGQQLKLSTDEIKELEQAGMFHDIGKISIPDSILNKPGKLTDEEYDVIKTHTEVGYQILRAADEYSDLAIHALHHHERWDGKGYPSGMKGNDIPLFSRIICVVDAYEAMTADRPYRKKLSDEYAVSEIIKCSGSQFDPKIAKIFVEKILKAT